MDESDPDEFDDYTTALLFGGPTRVVQVALLLLHEQRRIRVSRATRRVEAVRREDDDDLGPEDDPVRAAVLDAIPAAGVPLGRVIAAVAASPEMHAIEDALRAEGLLRGRGRRLRPTREGRKVRRIIAGDLGTSRPERLAVLGPPGVEDARFRAVLEADDPKPIKLQHYRARGQWHAGAGGRRYAGAGEGAESDYGGGDFGGGDSGGGGGY
ncbi:TIGR04222 domain-containing membrane protein [Actinomadura welshii]